MTFSAWLLRSNPQQTKKGDHRRGGQAIIDHNDAAALAWPPLPTSCTSSVGMDFLERLRVVGASFVIFDLDLDNAALLPLSGDPNDVQDIGNARPVGGFTRNACEHVRRTLMHDAKYIGGGCGA